MSERTMLLSQKSSVTQKPIFLSKPQIDLKMGGQKEVQSYNWNKQKPYLWYWSKGYLIQIHKTHDMCIHMYIL